MSSPWIEERGDEIWRLTFEGLDGERRDATERAKDKLGREAMQIDSFIYFWFRGWMVNRGAPKPEVFCVVVSPTSVRIERRQSASEYPIETIASFEGAPRLVLIRKDGRRETLVPVFPDDADTIALAARLDELVVAARRWSGGYR